MTLESLGMLGEFVGGLAVLVTIGYLAYQIPQTRRLLEQQTGQQTAAMLRANIDGWNHMWAAILDDEDSIAIYHRLRRGEELQGEALERAQIVVFMFFLNLENFILQNQMTPFVEEVEPVVQGAVRHHVREILSSAAIRDWWEREKVCCSVQFREAVDGARQ